MKNSRIRKFLSKDISLIFISVFLKTFGLSLISIFIPIFFLSKEYSLMQIILYFLIYSVALVPIMFFCSRFTRFGLKKNLVFGTILELFHLYTILNVGKIFGIYFVAVISALAIGVYYFSFNIYLAKAMDSGKEGKQLSKLETLKIIAGMLAPLIGALIITSTGYDSLIFLSGIFALASIFPLFMGKDIFVSPQPINFFKCLKTESKTKSLIYVTNGLMEKITYFFWPVFIFLTLKSVLSLGLIITLGALMMAALVYFMGILIDKNARLLLTISIFIHSPLWALRIFLLSPIFIFVINFLSQLSGFVADTSINKHIFGTAKNNKNISEYFLHREIFLAFGRICILIIAGLFFYLKIDLEMIFFVGAAASLVYLVALKEMK